MTGQPYSDDLREYYYSADGETVTVATLELRHPAFDQPARVVNDALDGFSGTLEASAPANAGEAVDFVSAPFDITLPESNSPGLPSCQISVDNVGRQLLEVIDLAAQAPAPVKVTYREFIVGNDTAPEPGVVIDGMSLRTLNVGLTQVTATAGFEDDLNTPFGREKYAPDTDPGLVR